MKKVFFSFAVAAVAAVMVSCGNKSAQNAEAQEAEATGAEEQTEQVAESKAEPKEPEFKAETFECDYFTAEFPAGHKAEVADKYGWRGIVFPLKDDGSQANSGTRVQLLHPAKETVAEFIKKANNVPQGMKGLEKFGNGSYVIGGEKFQTWFKAGMVYFLRDDAKNGGCYNFAIPEFAFEKQELVMGVLNSIKFK